MGEICTGRLFRIDRPLERGLIFFEAYVEMPLRDVEL